MISKSLYGFAAVIAFASTAALAQSPPPAAAPSAPAATVPPAAAATAAPPAAAAPAAAAADEKSQRRLAACRDDLKSLCADVEKGGGRKVKCLKDNEAKLQPACKAVLGEIEADRAQKKADRKAGQAAATPAAPATK